MGVWFDTALRGLRAGSPRTAVGVSGRGRFETGPYARGRGTGWEGWVQSALWFDTPLRRTSGRLTTNGVGRR